jgi:hypothetical protein
MLSSSQTSSLEIQRQPRLSRYSNHPSSHGQIESTSHRDLTSANPSRQAEVQSVRPGPIQFPVHLARSNPTRPGGWMCQPQRACANSGNSGSKVVFPAPCLTVPFPALPFEDAMGTCSGSNAAHWKITLKGPHLTSRDKPL